MTQRRVARCSTWLIFGPSSNTERPCHHKTYPNLLIAMTHVAGEKIRNNHSFPLRCACVGFALVCGADHKAEVVLRQYRVEICNGLANGVSRTGSARDRF